MLTDIQKAEITLIRMVHCNLRMAIEGYNKYHKLSFIDSAVNSSLGAISACANFHISMDIDSYNATFYTLLREQVIQFDNGIMREFFRK